MVTMMTTGKSFSLNQSVSTSTYTHVISPAIGHLLKSTIVVHDCNHFFIIVKFFIREKEENEEVEMNCTTKQNYHLAYRIIIYFYFI